MLSIVVMLYESSTLIIVYSIVNSEFLHDSRLKGIKPEFKWFYQDFTWQFMYPVSLIRLSTTLDEVIVYPIPAALYLVKNLLQVGFCFLSVSTSLVFLLPEMWLYQFIVLCGSTIYLHMWMPQAIKYWRTWILSALGFYTESYLRGSKPLLPFRVGFPILAYEFLQRAHCLRFIWNLT